MLNMFFLLYVGMMEKDIRPGNEPLTSLSQFTAVVLCNKKNVFVKLVSKRNGRLQTYCTSGDFLIHKLNFKETKVGNEKD